MEQGDAFGRMLLDHLEGPVELHEVVERDDGFVSVTRLDCFAPL